MNDFLHLGFALSDCICFCTKVIVTPGSTGFQYVQTRLEPWLD